MNTKEKLKYFFAGLILLSIVMYPSLSYLKASLISHENNISTERVKAAFEKPVLKDDISVQETDFSSTGIYDAEWQREQTRLLRSFDWLEEELKIAKLDTQLSIYQSYINQLLNCRGGDWSCLDESRWDLDDFAFAAQNELGE